MRTSAAIASFSNISRKCWPNHPRRLPETSRSPREIPEKNTRAGQSWTCRCTSLRSPQLCRRRGGIPQYFNVNHTYAAASFTQDVGKSSKRQFNLLPMVTAPETTQSPEKMLRVTWHWRSSSARETAARHLAENSKSSWKRRVRRVHGDGDSRSFLVSHGTVLAGPRQATRWGKFLQPNLGEGTNGSCRKSALSSQTRPIAHFPFPSEVV